MLTRFPQQGYYSLSSSAILLGAGVNCCNCYRHIFHRLFVPSFRDGHPFRRGLSAQPTFRLVVGGMRHSFTSDAVNHLIKRIGERAGFSFPVHCHMLRHACGYALANAGHESRPDPKGHRRPARGPCVRSCVPQQIEPSSEPTQRNFLSTLFATRAGPHAVSLCA
jgi:hypothetical protein